MVGELSVKSNANGGVAVWRAPTHWDRLAYVLPTGFCLGAATGGIGLCVLLGPRFLLLVLPALALTFFFAIMGARMNCPVLVDQRGLVIQRQAQPPVIIPASLVDDITAEVGDRPYERGVVIRYSSEKKVVLYGLYEKDRVAAAHTLCDALNRIVPVESDGGSDVV